MDKHVLPITRCQVAAAAYCAACMSATRVQLGSSPAEHACAGLPVAGVHARVQVAAGGVLHEQDARLICKHQAVAGEEGTCA